jgi:hypothetical protein
MHPLTTMQGCSGVRAMLILRPTVRQLAACQLAACEGERNENCEHLIPLSSGYEHIAKALAENQLTPSLK